MRGTCLKPLVLILGLGLVAGCDELIPPEPEKPAPVVVKPVKKAPAKAAPAAPAPVKKTPVIVFDDGDDRGGGWD